MPISDLRSPTVRDCRAGWTSFGRRCVMTSLSPCCLSRARCSCLSFFPLPLHGSNVWSRWRGLPAPGKSFCWRPLAPLPGLTTCSVQRAGVKANNNNTAVNLLHWAVGMQQAQGRATRRHATL